MNLHRNECGRSVKGASTLGSPLALSFIATTSLQTTRQSTGSCEGECRRRKHYCSACRYHYAFHVHKVPPVRGSAGFAASVRRRFDTCPARMLQVPVAGRSNSTAIRPSTRKFLPQPWARQTEEVQLATAPRGQSLERATTPSFAKALRTSTMTSSLNEQNGLVVHRALPRNSRSLSGGIPGRSACRPRRIACNDHVGVCRTPRCRLRKDPRRIRRVRLKIRCCGTCRTQPACRSRRNRYRARRSAPSLLRRLPSGMPQRSGRMRSRNRCRPGCRIRIARVSWECLPSSPCPPARLGLRLRGKFPCASY